MSKAQYTTGMNIIDQNKKKRGKLWVELDKAIERTRFSDLDLSKAQYMTGMNIIGSSTYVRRFQKGKRGETLTGAIKMGKTHLATSSKLVTNCCRPFLSTWFEFLSIPPGDSCSLFNKSPNHQTLNLYTHDRFQASSPRLSFPNPDLPSSRRPMAESLQVHWVPWQNARKSSSFQAIHGKIIAPHCLFCL